MKYLVRIETYLTGVRTVAEFDTLEKAENFLNNYHFKQSKIVRENEVSGWIEKAGDEQ